MEITNWPSFYRLFPTVILMIIAVAQSFWWIKKKKEKNWNRIIIWSLVCICAIGDCMIHFLLTVITDLNKLPFPMLFRNLIELPILLKILILIFLVIMYAGYFQWNILCEYPADGKPGKESMYQKGSAIIMYMILIIHFVVYGMIFKTFLL